MEYSKLYVSSCVDYVAVFIPNEVVIVESRVVTTSQLFD